MVVSFKLTNTTWSLVTLRRWITDDIGLIFGWTAPLWEKLIYFIRSCRLLSSLIQYSANNTHRPSAWRNGITCIRFCQILPFSVRIPPFLLYLVFVCVQSGIRDVVLFLAPACVSTGGAEFNGAADPPWCSFMVLRSHSLRACILLQVQLGYVHIAIARFKKACFHLPSETISYAEINHGNMQCGSCDF